MTKLEFYTKLLAKLKKIKNGEMTLDAYIKEVSGKIILNSELKLKYYCPECEHEFEEEIWKTIPCPNCKTLLETDFFDDEGAGRIGECRTKEYCNCSNPKGEGNQSDCGNCGKSFKPQQ